MSSVTTKVGIELEVRMGKAQAEIDRLNKKLEHTRDTVRKADAQLGGLNKQVSFMKQGLAGPAGLVALLIGAVHAMDKMSKRAIELTGDTRGLAGSWQRLREEWSASADQLILIADRAPLAMRTIKEEVVGVDSAVDDQAKSVSMVALAWDDYIKKLTPMAGEDWLPAKAVAALNRELDELSSKQARPMLGGFGADVGAGHLAGGLTAARDKAAINEINRHHKQLARDTDVLNKLFKINADATWEMGWASRHHRRERKKEVDLFKAERAEFKRMFGEVEMDRASGSLSRAQDRQAFGNQLDEAKMAEAGQNAKKVQLDFEAEQHEKRQEMLREHNDLLQASLDAEIAAEQRKREEQQATMASRMQIADATAVLTSQSVALTSFGAEAFVKGEKRKNAVLKGLAGSEMIVIGIVESVKAAASFAGQNYVEGAMHVAASALAFAQGGKLLAEAGGGGRSVGPGAAGSGFASGSAFGPGDTGGGVQSSSGGSSSPTNNGPVSEEANQHRKHVFINPNTNINTGGNTVNVNVQHFGQIDDATGDKIRQAIKRSERRSGKVTT